MKSKTVELEAFALDDEGRGIVRDEGLTVFVDNLLPNEKGKIKLDFAYGKLKEARLLQRLTSSKDRVKPLCPYYSKCGGCNLMHLNYEAQLEYKRMKVQNLLHKFAKIDFEVSKTIGMENPYHFRNKIQVPVKNIKGKIETGFYEINTHNLVPNSNCLIEDNRARHIIEEFKKTCEEFKLEAYNEDTRRGVFRHIIIKTSRYYQQIMVVFVTAIDEIKGKQNFLKAFLKSCPEVTTVVQNINKRKTNVILGEKERILFGSGKIKDRIFDLDFYISSKSFYQTNPIQVEKLYKTAIDLAALKGDEMVLDAYSGTGTIGLCASRHAKNVTLVEVVEAACKNGIENAVINNIENAEFVIDDCTKYLVKHKDNQKFDVVFMDPPRKGSTNEFLTALIENSPKKIVYISCNPVTLARDLSILKDKYEIEEVIPVDMFPHTSHVETICALSFKGQKS